ncbi:cryptochrome/photolyase family protein [Halomicrococcus gelatinilyticus]|uniref:cryptochrome/photolyase family protein n=1 Tax=Halomicrococcus gelatinilyticus TaxID=1702103 RepID=UPI002E103511
MDLHWHRRDLRATDNRALSDTGRALPVFVLDDAILAHASPPRVAFMLDALDSLRSWYRERGGDLLVVRGDPAEELPRVARSCGADRVVWNRDYSGLAADRDAAVRDALDDAGVDHASANDAIFHPPGSITTNQGNHYSVFSYFWKKWRDRDKPAPYDAPEAGDVVDPRDAFDDPGVLTSSTDSGSLPSLADLGFDRPEADLPPAGHEVAVDLLEEFCADDVYRYADDRDYPAREGTSRLSPHLKFGTVGIRRVWAATDAAHADASDESERDSVVAFQRQLAWREFYAHVLDARPDVVTENYREYEHDVAWRDDEAELQAWKDGETGYPIVDAGMRQLRAEGWVNNRVRMIVASFFTKDLLLDWREGYDWYRRKLVDHDTANDVGGWQWAASTGTDAQPYFRIFNPATQCERHDPDGEYVRTYVPELRDVPPAKIHAWPTLDDAEREALAPDYPHPIVDHAERRERALATFEAARGDG